MAQHLDGRKIYEDENGEMREWLAGRDLRRIDKDRLPASPRFKIVKFLRYFYWISTGKYDRTYHPWLTGGAVREGVLYFLKALEEVAKY